MVQEQKERPRGECATALEVRLIDNLTAESRASNDNSSAKSLPSVLCILLV